MQLANAEQKLSIMDTEKTKLVEKVEDLESELEQAKTELKHMKKHGGGGGVVFTSAVSSFSLFLCCLLHLCCVFFFSFPLLSSSSLLSFFSFVISGSPCCLGGGPWGRGPPPPFGGHGGHMRSPSPMRSMGGSPSRNIGGKENSNPDPSASNLYKVLGVPQVPTAALTYCSTHWCNTTASLLHAL